MTRRRGSKLTSLDRLPPRFFAPEIDTNDVFGSLTRYVSDLDDWGKRDLGLTARSGVYHVQTYELMEKIAGEPLLHWVAEWIRLGMTAGIGAESGT